MPRSALGGLTVLDVSTLYAGPFAAMLLGDFGADVIKIEHPRGDPLRTHGHSKDGHGLWWKVLARNKRCVTLDLSKPGGQELCRRLVAVSDVVIENFRPGVMERWGLGYADLEKANPGVVMLRITGFGQRGPYARRPGFGTLAESMTGWVHCNGYPDGPPTLPPFGLADASSGLAGALAVMMALHARSTTGHGQMIDLALIEPLLTMLGPQPTIYDQLGVVQSRTGNRSSNSAPRNIYRTRDRRYVALAASAQSIAERVVRLAGRPDLVDEPWFKRAGDRARHADELDEAVGGWIAAHDRDEVIAAFEAAEAAIAPVYDVSDVMSDPHFAARESIIAVDDPDLGAIKMQNVIFRMSQTPGRVRCSGRRLGQDNRAVYGGLLGLDDAAIDELRAHGVC